MTFEERKAGRLRSSKGEIIDFPDLPTVQEWIVQGRIDRSFKIFDESKKRWRAVHKVPELAAFIHLVEASAPWETAHSHYLATIGS